MPQSDFIFLLDQKPTLNQFEQNIVGLTWINEWMKTFIASEHTA